MRRSVLLLAALLAASSAHGAVTFLARGSLSGGGAGAGADLSGLTGTLENGLPANILGGVGSGLAYAGGTTFVAVPDRGPNATAYNAAVDNTVSYVSRFHTIDMALTANTSGGGLPFTLTPTLTRTTLLSSAAPLTYGSGAGLGDQANGQPLGSGLRQDASGRYYFTGRSDNYGSGDSGVATNARFDPEGVRVSNDGKSVFISDEYGPYVRQFDRATGEVVKTFTLPSNLDVANLSPVGDTEIAGNASGRTANKGMEGLAITPDGKTLVGVMQAALIQDAADKATKKMVRIVTIDIATGATHEYGYMLTSGSGVSEITAINDHEFLVDERDGKGLGDGSTAAAKQLFRIDISGATDITGLSGKAAANAAIGKSLFLDLVDQLNGAGIASDQIPAKIEGITFGQDVTYNGEMLHTLFIANDNDFLPATSGDNQFFVFGFTDKDLPGYVAQAFGVPEPTSWALMVGGFGLVGAALRRRRTVVRFA